MVVEPDEPVGKRIEKKPLPSDGSRSSSFETSAAESKAAESKATKRPTPRAVTRGY